MKTSFYGLTFLFTTIVAGWTGYWAYVWYADSYPLAAAEVVYAITCIAALVTAAMSFRAWRAERPRREHSDLAPDYWRDELH